LTRAASIAVILAGFLAPQPAAAQAAYWTDVQAEATQLLQQYVRIDTSIPPGDVTKAADLLEGVLEREGIPVTRYESGPGRSIIVARLEGAGSAKPIVLLHHMDVVPADPNRWQRDPFGGEIADGNLWGRGAMDMKGIGVAHLMAFVSLKRQNVPLDRDVIFMAVPDEEIGGDLGNRWMLEQHYEERLLNPYIAAERGTIDAVIEPADTRREIAAAFEMLATKRERLPHRRHDNSPL
jgi:acetylornithine deacetylase/succinyl-diaminopimelate desuccinylase-like protein